jgi:hypothetical protein
MGFCTSDDVEEFFRTVPEFEKMLIRSRIILIKCWFSITDDAFENEHALSRYVARARVGVGARSIEHAQEYVVFLLVLLLVSDRACSSSSSRPCTYTAGRARLAFLGRRMPLGGGSPGGGSNHEPPPGPRYFTSPRASSARSNPTLRTS